ncbi:MAG: ATP-binding protein [Gemmatimonadales bacterium]
MVLVHVTEHDRKATRGCPCGYFSSPLHACNCGSLAIERYRSRISGPLLDRIDIHLEVPAVAYGDLVGEQYGESSAIIRSRVERARAVQRARFQNQVGPGTKSPLAGALLRTLVKAQKLGLYRVAQPRRAEQRFQSRT